MLFDEVLHLYIAVLIGREAIIGEFRQNERMSLLILIHSIHWTDQDPSLVMQQPTIPTSR